MTAPRTSETFMLRRADGFFEHDAHHPRVAQLYNDKLPVWRVRVTERLVEEGAAYWAWWDMDGHKRNPPQPERFEFVWRKRFFVDMCFAYGARVEEDHGNGKLLPVDIEPLEEVLP